MYVGVCVCVCVCVCVYLCGHTAPGKAWTTWCVFTRLLATVVSTAPRPSRLESKCCRKGNFWWLPQEANEASFVIREHLSLSTLKTQWELRLQRELVMQ